MTSLDCSALAAILAAHRPAFLPGASLLDPDALPFSELCELAATAVSLPIPPYRTMPLSLSPDDDNDAEDDGSAMARVLKQFPPQRDADGGGWGRDVVLVRADGGRQRRIGAHAATALPDGAAFASAVTHGGWSLVLRDADHRHAALRAATSRVAAALAGHTAATVADATDAVPVLSALVGCNVYATPTGGVALARHFDGHGVLVAQLIGAKAWRVYNDDVRCGGARYPRLGARRPAPADAASAAAAARGAAPRVEADSGGETDSGGLVLAVTLRPGDALFVPRGFAHEAAAAADNAADAAARGGGGALNARAAADAATASAAAPTVTSDEDLAVDAAHGGGGDRGGGLFGSVHAAFSIEDEPPVTCEGALHIALARHAAATAAASDARPSRARPRRFARHRVVHALADRCAALRARAEEDSDRVRAPADEALADARARAHDGTADGVVAAVLGVALRELTGDGARAATAAAATKDEDELDLSWLEADGAIGVDAGSDGGGGGCGGDDDSGGGGGDNDGHDDNNDARDAVMALRAVRDGAAGGPAAVVAARRAWLKRAALRRLHVTRHFVGEHERVRIG